MRTFVLAGQPGVMSRRGRAFDVVVAALAFASALPILVHEPGTGRVVAVVGLGLATLPLAVRRRWPLPVFVIALVVPGIFALAGSRVASGLGVGIALYTVAALRPRVEALTAGAVLELTMIAVLIPYAGSSWWYDAIFLSGLLAAALGLGLFAAIRRAYLAELHDRAERLERERDQQAALSAAAERARIAREMHDVVAHHLTVMVALSDGAVAASAASPERAAEVMRTVSATGRQALADTRRLLGVLRTSDGDEARKPVPDLEDLDELITRVRGAGLPVHLEVTGATPTVSDGIGLTVYRLVQEALTNTMKHGGAGATATVRLRLAPHEVQVEITDDGGGRAATTPIGAGNGLIGMRERVAAYGGEVSSGPTGPAGWRVRARLALDDRLAAR